jgi:hypothetical protein
MSSSSVSKRSHVTRVAYSGPSVTRVASKSNSYTNSDLTALAPNYTNSHELVLSTSHLHNRTPSTVLSEMTSSFASQEIPHVLL